jgi:subfamily B ATP-binding cassette protein HlyB/CyaB
MSPLEEVGHQEVIWLLGSLSGLYRLPFDAALVSQEFPPPYSIATFHEAARSLGLKTGSVGIEQIDWQKLPLPAIAFLRPVPVAPANNQTPSEVSLPDQPQDEASTKPSGATCWLASLAIQLVGLATPLFTQVIIDKVVVHQTHGTLIVLGVALLMFMCSPAA